MIITESYAIARLSALQKTKADKPKSSSPSLIDRIASVIEKILSLFSSRTSDKQTSIAYKAMLESFEKEGRKEPTLSEIEFAEIFNAHAKKQLKPNTNGIVRNVKGKKLARPVLITENGPFILFTRTTEFNDPRIGSGAESTVKLAYNLNDHKLEALIISKDNEFEDTQENRSKLERPIAIMKKVGEAFAPKVHGCAIEKWEKNGQKGLRRYVINTLFQGSLSKLDKASDKDKLNAIEQILKILVGLEKKGIVHGDIKNDNFVFRKTDSDIEVKQIDNERSFIPGQFSANKEFGTIAYTAPELLRDLSLQSSQADIYSAMITIMKLWGYKLENIESFINDEMAQYPSEIIELVPSFTQSVNNIQLLLKLAGRICLQPEWFCPDEGDVLGKILIKGLNPDPSKRQSAACLLLEIEERREEILKSAKLREKQMGPSLIYDSGEVKAAFENALKAMTSK